MESEKTREIEQKEAEINELKAAKMEVEESYNRTIKSKKLSDEKERILLNTFDALKKYYDIKDGKSVANTVATKSQNNQEVSIDITGEEEQGGSSSKTFHCKECKYVTSMENRLHQHKTSKHPDKNSKKEKGQGKNSNKEKQHESDVSIPCDVCEFTAISASEYMEHTKTHHGASYTFDCDICDYKGHSSDLLIKHVKTVHESHKKGHQTGDSWKTVNYRNKNPKCYIAWNKGHCRYTDSECKYFTVSFLLESSLLEVNIIWTMEKLKT